MQYGLFCNPIWAVLEYGRSTFIANKRNVLFIRCLCRDIQLIPTFYFPKTSTYQLILRENWSRRIS